MTYILNTLEFMYKFNMLCSLFRPVRRYGNKAQKGEEKKNKGFVPHPLPSTILSSARSSACFTNRSLRSCCSTRTKQNRFKSPNNRMRTQFSIVTTNYGNISRIAFHATEILKYCFEYFKQRLKCTQDSEP